MNNFYLACADCDKKRMIGFSILALIIGSLFALKKLIKKSKKQPEIEEPKPVEKESEND